jgi:hypothetical protein
MASVMQPTPLPTIQDIETLTAFLPRLYAEGFSPILRWDGGERLPDGSYSMHYPIYNQVVAEFFNAVRGPWIDYDYDPERAYQMLQDEQAVKSASLGDIKTMLTFCLRGERFSDGHWGVMIEKGFIRRVLERLNQIKRELK